MQKFEYWEQQLSPVRNELPEFEEMVLEDEGRITKSHQYSPEKDQTLSYLHLFFLKLSLFGVGREITFIYIECHLYPQNERFCCLPSKYVMCGRLIQRLYISI